MKSPIAKKYIKDNSSGSAQGFIGLGKLRAFPIPFRKIEMQEKIRMTIQKLDTSQRNLERVYSEKLLYIEELKKSLLQKAFAGELTSEDATNTKAAMS